MIFYEIVFPHFSENFNVNSLSTLKISKSEFPKFLKKGDGVEEPLFFYEASDFSTIILINNVKPFFS